MQKNLSNWYQKGNNLFFKYKDTLIYFDMPSWWKLEEVHPTIIKFAEFLIIGPLAKEGYKMSDIMKWEKRPMGDKTGLSFSTGLDSTAAMLLLPEDTILYYNRRKDGLCGAINQSNALHMIEKMDRKVHVIESNHEATRLSFGYKRVGFTTDYACAVGLILMADYFNLGYIATGTMLGSTFVYKGAKYIEYIGGDKHVRWNKIFEQAGLKIIMPVAGCSEVITNKIVQDSIYKNLSYSCIRGELGKSCNKCFKCYRKNLLNGTVTDVSEEIIRNIRIKPIHQGDSLLYGLQKHNISFPETDEYKNLDMGWMERYYPKALGLVTEEFREGIKRKLKDFGIEPMDDDDIENMKKYSIDNEKPTEVDNL